MRKIRSLIQQLVIAFLHVCRLQLGFWQAPMCLFEETCTRYSQRQIEEHFLPVAIIKICWRLACCNPITAIIRIMHKNKPILCHRSLEALKQLQIDILAHINF
ncbi:membrane protein insertion efficiency factor YidD [Candidatus Dependentiae bacterium]|nr:membrane protein insertion efficiency factor YidD [Candidatus Dependentiae bacterium]